MPHDKTGIVVEVNDVLFVPVVVKRLHTGEDYCNADVETVEKMFPGEHKTNFTINTKQGILERAFVSLENYTSLLDRITVLETELAELKPKE